MRMHALSRSRTPRIADLAAAACISLAAPSPALAVDTVTYTATTPAFTAPNDFLFTSVGTVSIPYFDTLGGALVLERAEFTITTNYSITYDMTNNGATTTFADLQFKHQATGTGPGGVTIFAPPYGGQGGGPFIAPGQTLPNINNVTNAGEYHADSTTNALPFTGSGNYDLNATMSIPVTITNPAQFSAVLVSSQLDPPTVTVTYSYRCDGDTNGDHHVNVNDLLTVISAWGSFDTCFPAHHCPADIAPTPQTDYMVNVTDLLRVITRWGDCPQGPGN